jgi:hypothetical protein
MKQLICDNRLIDRKPESNSQWLCPLLKIKRSIQIGITGITTKITMKKPLITDTEFMAVGTSLGSICWTHSHRKMSVLECFIFDKLSQLESTPIRNDSIKSLATILFTDSFQIFESEECWDLLCFYNLLAYNMIHIPSKPFLSATQSFEMSFGRFRAFTLKLTSDASESINIIFDIPEEFAIASNGEMVNAEVNANNVFDRANVCINLFGNPKMEKEFSTTDNKFTLSNIPIHILSEIFWDYDWNLNPTLDTTNAQDVIFNSKTTRGIIPNATIKEGLGFCKNATFISTLDCSNNELGLELREFSPHLIINCIIEFEIRMIPIVPTNINGIINSIGIDSNSLPKNEVIFEFNLNDGSVFHNTNKTEVIYKHIGNEENKRVDSAIHPTDKSCGLPCLPSW